MTSLPLLDQVTTQSDDFTSAESAPTNSIFTKEERTHQNFTDRTGVSQSSRARAVNTCILIMYSYDANYKHVETMHRGKGRLLDVRLPTGACFFKARGAQPRFERLGNESCKALEEFMTTEKIAFQYVPPGAHRRNAAERAIWTFKKNHFSFYVFDPGVRKMWQ